MNSQQQTSKVAKNNFSSKIFQESCLQQQYIQQITNNQKNRLQNKVWMTAFLTNSLEHLMLIFISALELTYEIAEIK